jgi:UDP-N-acetylglucosamine 4,6-dehydratase (inverting)
MILDNANILITGGSGSFGTQFVKTVLKEYSPKVIRVFSRGEILQEAMQKKFNDDRLRFFIGDVKDRERLKRALDGVNIVVHAAALKIVPTCEYSPIEAINTNIDGARNLIGASIDCGVERVIAISTDKCCQPNTLYGGTKFVAERLFTQANVYGHTRFACTRYGNVLLSRGSILPLFLKQRETGELTITDDKMTRFWLTLEQGVHFVINSLQEMQGGEVFVPKIPSMKIIDMADAIAPEAKKKIIGIRAGEKIHEVLISEEESVHTKEFNDHFVILPEFPYWKKGGLVVNGKPMSISKYTSDANDKWLSKEELLRLIDENISDSAGKN